MYCVGEYAYDRPMDIEINHLRLLSLFLIFRLNGGYSHGQFTGNNKS